MIMKSNCPRVMLAGLSGDSGKTFVSTGLARLLSEKIGKVQCFKKGPDYIDAAWLKAASGKDCFNLDSYFMADEVIRQSFVRRSKGMNMALIEANRGLFDGLDTDGSHSSATVAKMIKSPVVLIVNITKVTRTTAAIVLGCRDFDKELNIAGVILNNVAGRRHEKIARESIEKYTGIKVIGAIPKLKNVVLPSRHLGLVTPEENELAEESLNTAKQTIDKYIDIDNLLEIAGRAPEIEAPDLIEKQSPIKCKIGYFRDRAFTFYYPENLEALRQNGADLVEISSLDDISIPDVDGIYIGGGFPETNATMISRNRNLMESLKKASLDGMPIYAECGGLIYLGRSLIYDGKKFSFCNVFPVDFVLEEKPQGHGYIKTILDSPNSFFNKGEQLYGHEFHYSRVINYDKVNLTMKVIKGHGSIDKRDGFLINNTFGSFVHLHALGNRKWAESFVNQAVKYRLKTHN